MTNEEIDKEIERLKKLKVYNSKTKDGVPIEIGKTYYKLYDLSKGIEEIIPQENWTFSQFGMSPNDGINHYYLSEVFSTKENAKNDMEEFLNLQLKQLENNMKNLNKSFELLHKIKV